jgi:hypothetical protein
VPGHLVVLDDGGLHDAARASAMALVNVLIIRIVPVVRDATMVATMPEYRP